MWPFTPRKKRTPLVKNPMWRGWARCRGLFRPWIELGAYGIDIGPSWQTGLLAHEYEHMIGKHRLKLLCCWLGTFAVVAATVSTVAGLGVGVVAGVTAAIVTTAFLYRHFERYADTRAAEKTGLTWSRLVGEVLWVDPAFVAPWERFVYGADRVERMAAIAKRKHLDDVAAKRKLKA
jgi:hypothetical protein